MNGIYLVWIFFLGGAVSYSWIKFLTGSKLFEGLKDVPNSRSSHKDLIYRGAGFAFVLTGCVSAVLFGFSWIWALAGLLIGVLGLFDDAFQVSAKKRLIIQISSCLPFIAFLYFRSNLNSLELLAMLALVLMLTLTAINFYNFADGINGHLAIQALIAIFSWCFIYGRIFGGGSDTVRLSTSVISGSIAVFLWANVWKKSVFMGDSGSTFLGFFVMTLPILWSNGQILENGFLEYFLFSLVFSFIVLWDCTSVLVAKIYFRLSPSMAHRHHFYQQLSRQSGLSQVKASTILGVWQFLIVATFSRAWLLNSPAMWTAFSFVTCAFACIAAWRNYLAIGTLVLKKT